MRNVLHAITIKIRTPKKVTQSQTNTTVACGLVSHAQWAFSLQHKNIPQIFLVFSFLSFTLKGLLPCWLLVLLHTHTHNKETKSLFRATKGTSFAYYNLKLHIIMKPKHPNLRCSYLFLKKKKSSIAWPNMLMLILTKINRSIRVLKLNNNS